jgi:hypothetical protein
MRVLDGRDLLLALVVVGGIVYEIARERSTVPDRGLWRESWTSPRSEPLDKQESSGH